MSLVLQAQKGQELGKMLMMGPNLFDLTEKKWVKFFSASLEVLFLCPNHLVLAHCARRLAIYECTAHYFLILTDSFFQFFLHLIHSVISYSHHHPPLSVGRLGSMSLTHLQIFGLSLWWGSNVLVKILQWRSNLLPPLSFSFLDLYLYVFFLTFSQQLSHSFFLLFNSPILEVKSAQEKCFWRSFCLALSFSHFLPNTFLPSWPASQFLLLPLSPPKSPGVKSAEASVFAARVMVITELRDHLRMDREALGGRPSA